MIPQQQQNIKFGLSNCEEKFEKKFEIRNPKFENLNPKT